MLTLPNEIMSIWITFAPFFSTRLWPPVQILVVGAVLATGKRTVTAVLRVMGRSQEKQFQKYHRVLNRATWSSRRLAQHLLALLVQTFVPQGPLVFGIDDTIERRRGEKIKAKGIYRDPVRSSPSHFVKASGLRWISVMWLARIPWAERTWALPFLTVLAPSERYDEERGKRHKKLTDWARPIIGLLRRWWPERDIVVVSDSSYSTIPLVWYCSQRCTPVTLVTRRRRDAGLYESAPPRRPDQTGRPRRKGARRPTLAPRLEDPTTAWQRLTVPGWYGEAERVVEVVSDPAVGYPGGMPVAPLRWVLIRDPLGKFDPQARLCTDLNAPPLQILSWFIQRWPLEVTLQEVRATLGVETQRQWSDRAIARTTPARFGLFSLVTLWAHALLPQITSPIRQAAWYTKSHLTFSDALAWVRFELWPHTHFATSKSDDDLIEVPRALLDRFIDALCYAS